MENRDKVIMILFYKMLYGNTCKYERMDMK